ncbi:MAG: hypothetical protein EOO12_07220 [Chitinophagaceae bacterium]|nr:MAG: hypothetical protein EOO12_07220 [Chitinophagaceae bacterium]
MAALYKYGTALLLLLSLAGGAQPLVETRLDTVPQDGFYRVALAPELTRHARSNFADLRLRDERGEPVPYRVERRLGRSTFSWLTIPVAHLEETDSSTRITFGMPTERSSGFQLVFANTAARRGAALTGSDDGQRWYGITDRFELAPQSTANGGTGAIVQLSYPANTYRYIRLEIRNGNAAPLRLQQAGILMGEPYPERWRASGRHSFTDSSANGSSIVRIQNPRGELLERLRFSISRPKLFARNVSLREAGGRELSIGVLMDRQLDLTFPGTHTPTLELFIENGDNPRLQIDSIVGMQRQYDLIAFLERGRTYTLRAGDSSLRAPVYDLSGFSDSATNAAPFLAYGPLRTVTVATPPEADNRVWLWIALVTGVGVLGALSLTMLREAKKQEA